jgi:hypothetical protein
MGSVRYQRGESVPPHIMKREDVLLSVKVKARGDSGPVSKFSDRVDRVDRTGVATGLNYDSACASTAGNRARFRSTVIIPGENSVQSTGEIEPMVS